MCTEKTLTDRHLYIGILINYGEDTPILLVGNKLDLEMKREVSKEQIENFKLTNKISESIQISLETGENVEEMFLRLTKMLLNKLDGKKRKKRNY